MKRRSFLMGAVAAGSAGILAPELLFAEKAKEEATKVATEEKPAAEAPKEAVATEEKSAEAAAITSNAEGWNAAAFEAKSVEDAMKALGAEDATESDKIKIKAPDIAENGAVVPITVSSELEKIASISILAAKNGTPLAANFVLGEGAVGSVSTRIKMGKTSDVIALVMADGKAFTAKKAVKVTVGGCGG